MPYPVYKLKWYDIVLSALLLVPVLIMLIPAMLAIKYMEKKV